MNDCGATRPRAGAPPPPFLLFSATASSRAGRGALAERHDLLAPITGQDEHCDVVRLDIDCFARTPAENVTCFATFGSGEFSGFVNDGLNGGFGLHVNGVNIAGGGEFAAGQTLDFFDIFDPNPTFFTLAGIDEALALAPLNRIAFRKALDLDETGLPDQKTLFRRFMRSGE